MPFDERPAWELKIEYETQLKLARTTQIIGNLSAHFMCCPTSRIEGELAPVDEYN